MSTRRPRASMQDVARLAGVSAQTVSRVARGEDTVRPATTEKVRAAMRQLGYAPNRAAQALRSGAFNTVGVIGHRLARTGEAHITDAVTAALRTEGFGAMFVDAPSNSVEDFIEALNALSQSVDGVIVLSLETPSASTVSLPDGIPLVVGDFRYTDQYTAVGTDQATGTRDAVRHLLDLGHETVHHIAGPTTSVQAKAREEAWIATLWEHGRAVPPLARGDWSPRSGYEAGLRLLEDPGVTAVFSANDEMALGLIRACHETGRRIPEDVSIVGFDDIMAEWMWPPLTTVAQDFTTIGTELVAALLPQLRGEPGEPRGVLVPAPLVVRRSTAVPRGT
ncbi:LacI family DNA-binding transcriptional regulator [Propionibacterium ruminifibrarum]|nr:LacI family DNA-binding transcriptional regulator [Propionibacterium ruminifibrarum]